MPNSIKLAAAPAVLAALSLTATPASAAELALPVQAPTYADVVPIFDIEEAQTAEHHRRHRHRHHYRYRRGPGLGDVLAGVLIVGAIAHVANEASRNDRRYRDRDYRRDVRYDESRGIDRAVNMCLDAVDRERRVESVDRVDRTARGWRVEGTITRGDPFTCQINERGRVYVDFGSNRVRYEGDDDQGYDQGRYEDIDYEDDDDRFEFRRQDDDKQLDDDRYASEWSKVDRQAAYPGGPVDDGNEQADGIDGDLPIGTGYKGAGTSSRLRSVRHMTAERG